MLVRGEEHSAATLAWMDRKGITRIEVEPLSYTNHFDPRCGRRGGGQRKRAPGM